jgi:hypothetical protein
MCHVPYFQEKAEGWESAVPWMYLLESDLPPPGDTTVTHRAGGLLRTSTQPTLCVEGPSPRIRMGIGIHPGGKSCGHVRSRLDCLFPKP